MNFCRVVNSAFIFRSGTDQSDLISLRILFLLEAGATALQPVPKSPSLRRSRRSDRDEIWHVPQDNTFRLTESDFFI